MQPNKITSNSIPLLQILDSIKLIKQIPDTTVDKSIWILKKHITKLDEKRLATIVKLSMKYPPRVRALLGAILESTGNDKYTSELKQSLNPTSTYSIGLNDSSDINPNNWNIE